MENNKKPKVDTERRYAFATKEMYSAVYKKLTEKGFEITVPIFSHSGYVEIHTNTTFDEFAEIFKEATGVEYRDTFRDIDFNSSKK